MAADRARTPGRGKIRGGWSEAPGPRLRVNVRPPHAGVHAPTFRAAPAALMFRPLALALLGLLALSPALAQEVRLSATAPRVLFAVTDSVKGDDGRYARLTTVLRYHPEAGEYVHTVEDAAGRVLARHVRPTTLAGPTAEEAAAAEALVAGHTEVARLVAAAAHPVVIEGGFPLVREAGPCGPGSRCLTYDVVEVAPAAPRRLRYVVVDLRTVRVADADADPVADGNLAHPAARRQSRSW